MYLCEFCDELRDGRNNSLRLLIDESKLESRVVGQSDNFIAFPGLGGLVAGYVLIIPKVHINAIGQISNYQFQELENLLNHIRKIVERHTGMKTVVFEHGSGQLDLNISCGACIDHAHLHICPTKKDFAPSELLLDSTVVELESFAELQFWRQQNYIFYEAIDGKKKVYQFQKRIPSQYMRQLWAKAVGSPDRWDWFVWPELINLFDTIDMFRD